MYAHVSDGVVDTVGRLPIAGWDGTTWLDLKLAEPAVIALCGWYLVEESAQPGSTAQSVYIPSYSFADDKVIQYWSPRPKTQEELLVDAEATNRASIEEALTASLVALQAIIDDTNASINTNPAARIKDLARVQRRLIRLACRRLDGTA